jgi:hypothetical protein
MRTETSEWLAPMAEAAARTDIDPHTLLQQASMPAAEADDPFLDQLARNTPPGATAHGIDWVRFGQLLRHELGWDDTYPAFPNFPELREQP